VTQQATDFLNAAPRKAVDEDIIVNGRYQILLDGSKKTKLHTRVTTFASTLEDRYNLEKWALRMVALGLVKRSDLYALVASTHPDDKQALNDLCDQAKKAANADAKANMGTALHAMCQRVDEGEDITFPEPVQSDVAAYRAAMDKAGIVVIPDMIEKVVVLNDLNLAGKFDRGVTFGSSKYIADLKTGADLTFGMDSIAVQLACYANADSLYEPKTKKHTPMPGDIDKDLAIVIHLPAGQAVCNFYWVDIKAGWEAAIHAAFARKWRKRRDIAEIWTPGQPHVDIAYRRAGMVERLGALKAIDGAMGMLAEQWPSGVLTFKQSEQHDSLQLDQIEKVLCGVEDAVGAPFGQTDISSVAK
jgi:hypothetical protein